MQNVMTVEEIKAAYPNQWILVGNPQISVASLIAGVVIAHGKEKRELLTNGFAWRGQFERTMTYFTGEPVLGRRFLL
jgi:hypothetical protein